MLNACKEFFIAKLIMQPNSLSFCPPKDIYKPNVKLLTSLQGRRKVQTIWGYNSNILYVYHKYDRDDALSTKLGHSALYCC